MGMSTMSSAPSYRTAAEPDYHSGTPEGLPDLTSRLPSSDPPNHSLSSLRSPLSPLSSAPQPPSSAPPSNLLPDLLPDDIPESTPAARSLTPDIDRAEIVVE
jgi:hypothetical protein